MTNATTDNNTKAGPGDLAEIFYAPSAVFARRSDGKFGLPYIALVVLGLIVYFATKNLMQPVIDAVVSKALADAAAKGMPADRLESMRGIMTTTSSLGPMLVFAIGPFITALFIWIVGKIAKVPAVGTVALMVATFSWFPRLLGSVVGAIFAAMTPEGATPNLASISLSPARFVDATASPALAAFLGRFDLFLLWGIVLIAIGMRVAGKGTKGQAWTVAAVVWAIPTLLGLAGIGQR